MAQPRKTVNVQDLKAQLNTRIGRSECEEARKALCLVLESILHGAGVYAGYTYIGGYKGVEDFRHFYY